MIMQYRVMPEDGEVEYSDLEEETKRIVLAYGENITIKEIGPVEVGFGLKAVRINFQLDENLGSENLENQLNKSNLVGDVQIEFMDRL